MNLPTGQFIILAYCILTIFVTGNIEIFSVSSVIMIILSIIISCLSYFILNKYFILAISGIYSIISLAVPGFLIMSPLILYNTAAFPGWQTAVVFIISFISIAFGFYNTNIIIFCMVLIGIIFACYIQHIQYKLNCFVLQSNRTRDETTEHAILLESRNKSLLEKQDYEIYNATLKERNRIAREIHDNVGHLLSRSILLTGAIKTINKDPGCTEPLNSLQESLGQAMESIRESVHNLHDDSVNLEEAVKNLIASFNFCNINFTYDMGTDVSNEIKFSFISIIKEGLNNVYKHSNATNVNILLREHPAMYQLIIKDNGNTAKNTNALEYTNKMTANTGMGISNIASRASMLKGSMQIYTNDGFCIFITIPKI